MRIVIASVFLSIVFLVACSTANLGSGGVACTAASCACGNSASACNLDCGNALNCAPSCNSFQNSCNATCADHCTFACTSGPSCNVTCADDCDVKCSSNSN